MAFKNPPGEDIKRLREGVVNEAAAEQARKPGIVVVMDRCIYKDHLLYMK